jgi:hypothetical protein
MRFICFGFVFATIPAFVGCTHILPSSTPYYKNGPDQPESPQGDIPAGSKAWVIWRKASYARVWTDGGIDGWVWDRAVISIWDYEHQQAEDKKQKEAREKLLKAQRTQQAKPAPTSHPAE